MSHLTSEQIEKYAERETLDSEAHFASCPQCQGEFAKERAIMRALATLERLAPSKEFAARLERELEATDPRSMRRQSYLNWIGLAAFSSMLLLLVFAYQMIVALQYGGALDFLSLYASRPDLISTYPSEALSALAESLPLLEFVLMLGLLLLAGVLGQQFVGGWRSTAHDGTGK